MDKVIRNYDVPEIKPMNTKEFFKYLKNKSKSKKQKNNHVNDLPKHVHGPECAINEPPVGIEIVSLAIVLDNVVVDIMNVQKGFSEILLKKPIFIQIDSEEKRSLIGAIYNDEKFEIVNHNAITRRGSA
jgi:hypothetical protein